MTEQVADDVASLADAEILFLAVSAGILFPAVPARIQFLAGPVGPDGTLSSSDPAGIQHRTTSCGTGHIEKTIQGRISPAYRQTDGERLLGDTRPFWIIEMTTDR